MTLERYVLSLVWVAAHISLRRQAAGIVARRGLDAAPEPALAIHSRLWNMVHELTNYLGHPVMFMRVP